MPLPIYQVPINFTNFQPQISSIQSITLGNPTIITTTAPHGYSGGLYVRIYIPYPGATQIDRNASYLITVLSPTTFSIPLNSTNLLPYFIQLYPSTMRVANIGQVIPVAEPATTLANAVNNDVNN